MNIAKDAQEKLDNEDSVFVESIKVNHAMIQGLKRSLYFTKECIGARLFMAIEWSNIRRRKIISKPHRGNRK